MRSVLVVLLVAVLGVFVSCSKDDKLSPTNFAKGLSPEVVLMVKNNNGKPLYAVNYYAYCSVTMKKPKVTSPDKKNTVNLVKDNKQGMRYVKIATPKEYKETLPLFGVYDFETLVTKKDLLIKGQDELYNEKLGVISVKNVKVKQGKTDISWDLLKDADAYRVKLFSLAGRLLYRSPVLTDKTQNYAFNKITRGWMTAFKPTKGKKYKVELSAIRFEKAYKNKSNRGYNVQCISFDEKEIVWNID